MRLANLLSLINALSLLLRDAPPALIPILDLAVICASLLLNASSEKLRNKYSLLPLTYMPQFD